MNIKIFGSEFIKNNINKCKIIVGSAEYNLFEYINI